MKSSRDNRAAAGPWFARAVIVSVAMATTGCGSSRADRAQVPEPVVAAADEHTAMAAEPPAADTATTVTSDKDASAESPAQTEGSPAEEAAKPAHESRALPAERFLLLSPAGPLVCELSIEADGQGEAGTLEKLVDEAIEATSSFSDGSRTWNAVVEAQPFRYGQFGNVPMKTAEERQQAIRRYDWNRDGRVDRDEMRRLLTRESTHERRTCRSLG